MGFAVCNRQHAGGKLRFALLAGALLIHFVAASFAVDKSGVSPNTISLPNGPGSIEGLGESFQPRLNTGTAFYSVPLKVPPGTAGHTPSLALAYEGGAPNGPVGFGWALPMSRIQRQTDQGIPRYIDSPNGIDDDADGITDEFDEMDRFISNSKEQLVPVVENGYTNYFHENEGAFIRYRRSGNHWTATQPDGVRLVFGSAPASRISHPVSGIPFKWFLERVIDTSGNTILYTYTNFPGLENTNQLYLSNISYGPGAPPWDNFHFVQFEYGTRPDWFEDARGGFLCRTGMRLTNIVVGTQGPDLPNHRDGDFNHDGIGDELNRRYVLSYLDYAGTNSHWSLLAEVRLIGADDATSFPPMTFGYSLCDPPAQESASGHMIGGTNEPPTVMDNAFVDLIDLNGDALPDVLRTMQGPGGWHECHLNLGEVSTNGARVIRWSGAQDVGPLLSPAWQFDLAATGNSAHLSDMNGDGLADFVVRPLGDYDEVFYFGNQGTNVGWGPQTYMTVPEFPTYSHPPAPFDNPGVRTADMDFNKHIDIVQSIDVGGGMAEYRVWYNLGSNRYSRPLLASPTNGLPLELPGVDIADFNGDRVPDIVWIRTDGVEAAAGLGYGELAPTVSVPIPGANSPLSGFQLERARLRDITGDGLADLVIDETEGGDLWYWVNQGNYTFSAQKTVTDMPSGTGIDPDIRWADMNGNGTLDLVYADREWSPRITTVDFCQLNLLTHIDNGIGAKTTILYEPSTKFRTDDRDAGAPWPDPMPSPVTVVARVLVDDSLGHIYTNSYRYHDGYYDPDEKEFRGFARAELIQHGDPTAPTLVTRSHFDTGSKYDAMQGKLLMSGAHTASGGVFWSNVITWVSPPKILWEAGNGQSISFVHRTAEKWHIAELGKGTPRTLESRYAYDRYGNQTLAINYGIVNGADRSAFNDERVTVVEYALNTEDWLVRFPKRQELMDEASNVLSRVETYYDDETFSGGNFGAVTRGLLTMTRQWVDVQTDQFITSIRNVHDSHGNITLILDPLATAGDVSGGHTAQIEYDPQFHAYPARETVYLGGESEPLGVEASHDAGFGAIISAISWNGHQTEYTYDPFGRLVQIIRPDDVEGYPSVEYEYTLAQTAASSRHTGVVNYVETRLLDKEPGMAGGHADHYYVARGFVDGMGRSLMRKAEAGAQGATVDGALTFNARGKPAVQLNPFYSVTGGLDFEDILAPAWQGRFYDETGETISDFAGAQKSEMHYDATLRTIRGIRPDSSVSSNYYLALVQYRYDENDTDPSSTSFGTPIITHRDGLGRLIRMDEEVGLEDDGRPSGTPRTWSTSYQYGLNNTLTNITDSQNNARMFGYDGLSRKLWMNDPDRGAIYWTYNDAGNVLEQEDAKGQRIQYTYDGGNRLLSEDYLDEGLPFSANRSPDVEYHYDMAVPNLDLGRGLTSTAENTRGNLAYVIDLSGEEHSSYDARGRVIYEVKRILSPGTNCLESFTTRWFYDPMDRVTSVQYPDEDFFHYEYDDRSLLHRITGDTCGEVVESVSYLPSGQIATRDYGNNVRSSYTYDNRHRLYSLNTKHRTQNTSLISFSYSFDRVSNITRIDDLRPETAVPAGDPNRNSQFFDYDDLNRLTRVQYSLHLPGQPIRDDGMIAYRYDRIGNMLSQTSTIVHAEDGLAITDPGKMISGGGPGGSWNRVGRDPTDPPGPHALTSIEHPVSSIREYSYDANGNLLNGDGLDCTWDFLDHLVTVSNDDMVARYTYDYTGRRIVKEVTPYSTLDTNFTFYINRLYEFREGQPVKYVWDAGTRVVRLTETRKEEYSAKAGWNLFSIAVQSDSAAEQLGIGGPGIEYCYRWVGPTQDWRQVDAGDPLPAGSVFWLKAAYDTNVSVSGLAPELIDGTARSNGEFLPCPELESILLDGMAPPVADARMYQAAQGRWLARHGTNDLASMSDIQGTVRPGDAVFFVNIPTSSVIRIPGPTLVARYFHQDHLGSSAVVADEEGALITQSTFYPYGHPRNVNNVAKVCEPYSFTQKERDSESNLHYYEARYYVSGIARFASVDPLTTHVNSPSTPYGYAGNNPVVFRDPTGLKKEKAVGTVPAEWADYADANLIDPLERRLYDGNVGFRALKLMLGEGPTSEGKWARRIVDALWPADDIITAARDVTKGMRLGSEAGAMSATGGSNRQVAKVAAAEVGRASSIVLTLTGPASTLANRSAAGLRQFSRWLSGAKKAPLPGKLVQTIPARTIHDKWLEADMLPDGPAKTRIFNRLMDEFIDVELTQCGPFYGQPGGAAVPTHPLPQGAVPYTEIAIGDVATPVTRGGVTVGGVPGPKVSGSALGDAAGL